MGANITAHTPFSGIKGTIQIWIVRTVICISANVSFILCCSILLMLITFIISSYISCLFIVDLLLTIMFIHLPLAAVQAKCLCNWSRLRKNRHTNVKKAHKISLFALPHFSAAIATSSDYKTHLVNWTVQRCSTNAFKSSLKLHLTSSFSNALTVMSNY